MNPTNIDYLFQTTATPNDRAPSTNRNSDDDAAGFNDHLNQASASVFDVLRATSPADVARSQLQRSDRSQPTAYKSNSDASSDRPSDPPAPPPSQASNSTDQSADASESSNVASNSTSATNSAKDDSHDDDRDKDRDDGVAGAAGAVQPSGKDTPTKSANDKREANQTSAADATDKSDAKETAKDRVTADIKDKEASTKIDAAVPVNQLKPNEADSKAVQSISETEASGKATATEEKVGLEKGAKQAKSSQVDQAAKEASVHVQQGTPDANERRATVEAASATTESTSQPTAQTASNAAEAVADAKSKLSETDSKDGTDSHRDEKASVDASTHTDVPASANTANTTAVANLTVPTTPSPTPDLDKLKSGGDQSTKAVTAKAETAVGPLGRTLRETTDLTRGASSSNSTDTPQVDPARFVSRVVKAVQTANDRGGPLQLRLSPPELGSLKIQLTVKDGVMSASMEADNATTRRLLLDHLPTLRDRLAEQNIRVDRFDVDVKQESNGQPNSAGSGQNPYQQQAQQNEPKRLNTPQQANEPTPPAAAIAAPRISSTGINLVV